MLKPENSSTIQKHYGYIANFMIPIGTEHFVTLKNKPNQMGLGIYHFAWIHCTWILSLSLSIPLQSFIVFGCCCLFSMQKKTLLSKLKLKNPK